MNNIRDKTKNFLMRRSVCGLGLREEIRKSEYTSYLIIEFLHGKGKSFITGQPFSVKDQVVNIWGFEGHAVSVSTTRLWWCSKN